jgi:alkylhydroperoxidase/carboxymuconolactone decarboxylase family protein YurZ
MILPRRRGLPWSGPCCAGTGSCRWAPTRMRPARFQETLRSLAMIDEGFVKSEAGLALGAGGISALDPKTAALLQVGAAVTIGSSPVCLQWSVARAAAGATGDEIADVLLAIAPVAGLGGSPLPLPTWRSRSAMTLLPR